MNSLNSIISNNKVGFGKLINCRFSNPISFKGQLEDDYFKSAKNNNNQGQLSALKNIGFDVSEIDLETGANFLHFAIQSHNADVIGQALLLLSKKKISKEAIESIVEQKDASGKTPYDYAQDEATIKKIEKYTGAKIQTNRIPNESAISDNNDTEIKLNNLPEGTKIDIPTLDDDDDDIEFLNQTIVDKPSAVTQKSSKQKKELPTIKLEEVAGHNKAKDILLNRIVKPLQDDGFVTDNGFLIHDTVGNGKTFLLNALSTSLGMEIFDEKLFDEAIDDLTEMTKDNKEKYKKSLADIFSKNIIQVSNLQDLEKVTDLARKSYQSSGKQAVVFVDEIKGILPDISAPSSQGVTKAEQLIENSAQKGFILVATTREMDAIKPESIRYGRFDKKIELRPPDEEERKELITKYYKGDYQLSSEDIENVAKLTAGFTYINFLEFLENIENDKITDYETLINELRKYAKKQNLGELTEKGTTACYDTQEFKRSDRCITFDDVAGMTNVKNKFKVNLIDRLIPENINWSKEHNRNPINSGFLLYGPPGTGKTFIAEAVAGEANIPIYIVDKSSFKDKYYGETEKKVKKLFEQLENKYRETGEYSILFIDEADDLLAKRNKELSSKSSSNNGDSSLVNLFLPKLNESAQRGVIVIAATNFREDIDDAVLDRLQNHIEVQFPDEELRTSIIKAELSKLPKYTENITNEEIKEISDRLGGLSSRVITAMIKKALDDCVYHQNRKMTLDDFTEVIQTYSKDHNLPEINKNNKTSGYDVKWKRADIGFPSCFDDVAGMDNVKEIFKRALIDRLKPEAMERYKKDGNRKPIQSNFLLYGPPGTGKTFIAEAVAGEMNVPIYEITAGDIKAGLYGESEQNIKSIFNQLETKFKQTGEYSILFIDEANDLFGSVKNGAGGVDKSLVNLFLQNTNKSAENGVIVIAATNYKNQMEDAMLSRLGTQIYVPLPDDKLRQSIIEKEIRKSKVTKNIIDTDIKRLSEKLTGFSSRDISFYIKEAINEHLTYSDSQMFIEQFLSAIDKFIEEGKSDRSQSDDLYMKLFEAIKSLPESDIVDFINKYSHLSN